jgi:hypothetical protein
MCALALDHHELIVRGHVCLSSTHGEAGLRLAMNRRPGAVGSGTCVNASARQSPQASRSAPHLAR